MADDCPAVQCVPPNDLEFFGTQGFPPQPLPPIIPVSCQYKNQQVYFGNLCPGAGSPIFTGSLPVWATLDSANNRFVVSSGAFCGATQLAANNNAQLAINQFAMTAIQNGQIVCRPNYVVMKTNETGNVLPQEMEKVRYINGIHFVCGRDGNLYISSDGKAWSKVTGLPTDQRMWDIAFDGTNYVVAGQVSNLLATHVSTNLTTWTNHNLSYPKFEGMAFGAGVFVGATFGGAIYYSSDAVTWTLATSPGGNFVSVKFLNGKFFVTDTSANPGNVYVSSDGMSWSTHSTNLGLPFEVAWNGSFYIACGWGDGTFGFGGFSKSTDGSTWVRQTQTAGFPMFAIDFGAGVFMSCGQQGYLSFSVDGVNWNTIAPAPSTPDYQSIAFDGSKFVVVWFN